MSFPFQYILNSLQSSLVSREKTAHLATLKYNVYKLITILKKLNRLKQEWQKSPAGTRQTDGKNLVWFGEIERKLAEISKTTFCLPFFLLIILWSIPTRTYDPGNESLQILTGHTVGVTQGVAALAHATLLPVPIPLLSLFTRYSYRANLHGASYF
jgi:hypothetical protein